MTDTIDRPAPVVLVHGLRGFDRPFTRRPPTKEFFPGVAAHLRAAGYEVYAPRVSPTASIAVRARELLHAIRCRFGVQPVHLIGHSLGGLDARYLVSRLGFGTQAKSLTTVGTPHRGTAFADWGVARFARLFRPLLRWLGLPGEAILDLTTDACARFNDLTPDVPGVRTASVAGECLKPWLGVEWQLSARIVGESEGPNDGVVSVASAAWGERQEVWQGDHLNLVNRPNRLMRRAGEWQDRAADYASLLTHFDR